ncbi:MAG: hypothetical protein JO040_03620 [Gemmatimonadetes bacterium]|nr:hypothetical protein [Gemmatimonadota bacterium]
MAIGDDEYKEHGLRYTGRHWWGTLRGNLVEPLLGAEADAAAFRLGMHTLIKGESGTAILVVAPRSPEAPAGERLQGIIEEIARSAAEYAWPHMLPGRTASIDLQVTLDKKPVQVRTPATDPRLRVFADAFTRCQQLAEGKLELGDSWPWHHRILKSSKPVKVLGTLTWHQALPSVSSAVADQPQAHVALIRNPHFVVTYRDVPIHPSGGNTYGVFLGDPDLDGDYAASENQIHSEWKPRKGVHFDPARRVLNQLNDEIRERPRVGRTLAAGGDSAGVVSIASALGVLLDGQTAIGDSRIPWFPEDPFKKDDGPRRMKSRARIDSPVRPLGTTSAPTSTTSDQPSRSAELSDRCVDADDPFIASQEPYPLRFEESSRQCTGGGDSDHSAQRLRRPKAPAIRLIGDPQLCVYEGVVAAEYTFRLGIARGLREVTISANPIVFVDGGRETEAPLDAGMPHVIAWRDLSTGDINESPRLVIIEPTNTDWSVLVSQLPDAAVGVDLSVENYA